MDLKTIQLIMEILKGGTALAVELIPVFIHRDEQGKPVKLSIMKILERADERNAETLRLIAEANAGFKK